MSNFTFLGCLELVKKFVLWVVGGWVVCKAILVFYFGPDKALGLGLRLGPSRTIDIFTGHARPSARPSNDLSGNFPPNMSIE